MGAVKITFKQLRCKKNTTFTANFIVLFYCAILLCYFIESDLRLWRSDIRFLAPVVIMAVNTSNPFKAIRQLIEETNKDLSILQEGVEK